MQSWVERPLARRSPVLYPVHKEWKKREKMDQTWLGVESIIRYFWEVRILSEHSLSLFVHARVSWWVKAGSGGNSQRRIPSAEVPVLCSSIMWMAAPHSHTLYSVTGKRTSTDYRANKRLSVFPFLLTEIRRWSLFPDLIFLSFVLGSRRRCQQGDPLLPWTPSRSPKSCSRSLHRPCFLVPEDWLNHDSKDTYPPPLSYVQNLKNWFANSERCLTLTPWTDLLSVCGYVWSELFSSLWWGLCPDNQDGITALLQKPTFCDRIR